MASRTDNAGELLKNLPVPEDDGAADGLEGSELPPVALTSTAGGSVDLSALPGTTVVYCYPMTGGSDGDVPDGWDDIPGARGCTPQSCAFRDHHAELSGLGARVFGLSTQGTDYQREAARRLRLPYELLSDAGLAFVRGVGLPTFEVEGTVLTKRLTMILKEGRIEKAFYPVFPPDRNAEEVIGWLSARATS